MRKFWLLLSILFIWTCGGGGGSKTTGPEVPPIVINLTSLTGQAQKGPFNNGTAINVAELTSALSPTGRNFSSAITDNSGRFSVANVQLESPYVELRANGYYFNEVSNEISSGQLTLFALSNLTGKNSINVNILTHLEKNRMASLIGNPDNPKAFAAAKLQAQEEVFAIFDYSRVNVPESELLDISQGGAANAKLLAISAIVQGDLTVGQMSELLANISTDIASDGTLDDTNLQEALIDNSKNLDMAQIRANLIARYASLGLTVTIPDFETEVNHFLKPPVVQDIAASMDEDTQLTVTLNGSDPEGESITYAIIDNPSNGNLVFSNTQATYTPNVHFNGTDTFTYKANDGTSDSNIGTVTITVNAIDDDPNTNDVSATTDEDTAVDVSLTADEYDGQNYSFGIIANPSNGTVSVSGTTATYTPNQDWNGTDTFTFEATDDRTARTNVATATITVNAVNDAPASEDEGVNTDEDTPVRTGFSSSDVEGDALTYIIVDQPSNGTVTIDNTNNEPGLYTPNADWNGTDTFTYKANDGIDDGNVATVTVTVNAINDSPIAEDGNVSTNENKMMQLVFELVATDVDGDNLTYAIVSNVSNGTTSIDGNQVTYTPNQDWHGSDGLTYKANDGTVDSNTATVVIGVTPVNDAPSVDNMSVETQEDTAVSFKFSYTEVDNDNLTFSIIANPLNGTITIDDAIASYTPNANWNGTDTFSYKANDGTVDSNTATVTITVDSVNDFPVVNDIVTSTDEDVAIAGITLSGTDADGDALTYSIVTGASNASVAFTTSSVISYTPNANWNGTDTFTYKANDGTNNSNTATITVTVNSVNDSPITSNVFYSIDEDNTASIDLIVNDSDPNDSFTFTIGTPNNGSITSPSGATVTYVPTSNWNGTDIFTYGANDGTSNSNTSTIRVDVNPIEDVPTFTDTSFTYSYGTTEYEADTLYFSSLLGLEDADGDAIGWEILGQKGEGSWYIRGGVGADADSLMYVNTDVTHSSEIANIVTVRGTDSNSNQSPNGTLTVNYLGGPQGLKNVQEYEPDWYDTLTDANTLAGAEGKLRDNNVDWYVGGSASLGETGYVIENRAGGANFPPYSRDYDRFDYWTAHSSFDIELNFSETTLAWGYLSESIHSTVPFAAYAINNHTNERIRLYAGYWDQDGSATWNVSGDWQGPTSGQNSYEPIYLFWPKDTSNTYDPANNSQYIADGDLTTSGGCGWGSGACGNAHGVEIGYPFMTATLIVMHQSNAELPTASGHSAYGSGYSTGSAIIFDTYFDKAGSSKQDLHNTIIENGRKSRVNEIMPEK